MQGPGEEPPSPQLRCWQWPWRELERLKQYAEATLDRMCLFGQTWEDEGRADTASPTRHLRTSYKMKEEEVQGGWEGRKEEGEKKEEKGEEKEKRCRRSIRIILLISLSSHELHGLPPTPAAE